MTTIDNIGYNLFPRNRNNPTIIPCAIDQSLVTAQFKVTVSSTGVASLTVCSYGKQITIDWGDGLVDTYQASQVQITYNHPYVVAGTYVISTSIQQCTVLECESSYNGIPYEKIVLKTVPIQGLGFGMQAKYVLFDYAQFSCSGLPFYDAIDLSQTQVSAIDITNYEYLSVLSCKNKALRTVIIESTSTQNLVFVDLSNNILGTVEVNDVLASLKDTNISNGLCALNGQNPIAVPTDQVAIDELRLKEWNVQVDSN